MNDPGLDAPISDGANQVEKDEDEEEEEHDFLDPSRWWFASTAFPLVAGTFGPMASAFSLCALVEDWRTEIPPGGTEEHGNDIPDPQWLVGINAVQLAVALIANISLLLNMARRLDFRIAQPITIIGWYTSSFLLIALVSACNTKMRLPSPPEHAKTQAYYYAIMAAVLYFGVASLMVVTVWGAVMGHYSRKFKLTISQRTLMLQTISFLVYLLAGAAVYSHVESWKFLDAVYWADFTLLTVGIGDYAPETHLGRSLLFPYAIGGIVILGLVIGSTRALILERGKTKLDARMLEKKRVKALKKTQKTRRFSLEPLTEEEIRGEEELERRKSEFHLMRKLQDQSHESRRWISLFISTFLWFVLWLIGAYIFRETERDQEWTYFESLYFAYTSLLTIGYGDFYPMSNSGKPFFVFWSLLAIPTMTVLISNMGDTVVKMIKDVTLWVGQWTLLPEDGIRKTLGQGLQTVVSKDMFGKGDRHTLPVPGISGENRVRQNDEEQHPQHHIEEEASSAIAGEAEEEELSETEAARRRGDRIEEDVHYYHYLLIREIRKVMLDFNASPPKRYSFEEWSWFLRLCGEDESNPDKHQAPPGRMRKKTQLSREERQRETMMMDEEGRMRAWSWLGHNSPLMDHRTEPEWILERLTATLEREMSRQRKAAQKHQRRDDSEIPVTRRKTGIRPGQTIVDDDNETYEKEKKR